MMVTPTTPHNDRFQSKLQEMTIESVSQPYLLSCFDYINLVKTSIGLAGSSYRDVSRRDLPPPLKNTKVWSR